MCNAGEVVIKSWETVNIQLFNRVAKLWSIPENNQDIIYSINGGFSL
jgi:hypothetical protein